MSEYLTKEEIKQWRSSLEKITLEEFAARLGKQIEETKHTNDLVDIVLKGKPYTSSNEPTAVKTERISSIAERAIEKERQIQQQPVEKAKPVAPVAQKAKKEVAKKPIIQEIKKEEPVATSSSNITLYVS